MVLQTPVLSHVARSDGGSYVCLRNARGVELAEQSDKDGLAPSLLKPEALSGHAMSLQVSLGTREKFPNLPKLAISNSLNQSAVTPISLPLIE